VVFLQGIWLKFCMNFSCLPCPHLSHPPWFIVLNIFGEKYYLWSSSLHNFFQPPDTSSLLGPNSLLSTLLPNILNLCPSLRDQVSYPYKIRGKAIVLYILKLTFLHMRQEGKKKKKKIELNSSKNSLNLFCS
jgi:hypothetical protein